MPILAEFPALATLGGISRQVFSDYFAPAALLLQTSRHHHLVARLENSLLRITHLWLLRFDGQDGDSRFEG